MAYVLLPGEPLDHGLRRIILEEMDAISTGLQATDGDRDRAVHEARKGFKRIRAALRLVRDGLGETTFQRENRFFRDASRRLAALRDSAVLLETLDGLVGHYPADTTGGAFDEIRRRLSARHEATRERFLTAGDHAAEVAEALQGARQRIAALPLPAADQQLIQPGLQRVYARGRRGMARAYAAPPPAGELFHDWRKRVKYLWHQLQILTPAWPPLLEELIRELHNLSDYLGDAHDLVVLEEIVSSDTYYFYTAPGVGLLRRLAERRAGELETLAHPLGRRLFVETADSFAARMGAYVDLWRETGISPQPPEQTLLSVSEAAAALQLSPGAVRRRLYNGELPGRKVGNVWVVVLSLA